MKKNLTFIALALVVTVAGITYAITQDQQPQTITEGEKCYFPTRLEWLAIELNTQHGVKQSEGRDFTLSFYSRSHQNTIVIVVVYRSTVDRGQMNRAIADHCKFAKSCAKVYGWDSWVKIEEQMEMVD